MRQWEVVILGSTTNLPLFHEANKKKEKEENGEQSEHEAKAKN